MRDKVIGRARFGETAHLWDDAIVAWADYIKQQVGSARTVARYANSLSIAGRTFSTQPIADIGKDEINQFVSARRKSGVTNATIRRDLQAISSLFDFAEDEGWREGNPALDKMRRLKEHRDPIALPDEADYEFVLSRLSDGHADMLRAARATGMRQNELATIKRKDFNAAKASLLLIGKGRKQRTISLSPEAVVILARQPIALKCETIFHHGGKAITQAAFIFSRARRAAQAAAQKAERPFRGFRFHDMRHLYAVEFLRAGGDIYALKEHLRHSSVKTTEMYLEFLTPEEAEIAKRGARKALDAARGLGEEAAPVRSGRG
ncbi:tyrosine-type recombinase/integrase [Mesorhizobium sp. BR1-1-16]|uniref:tyrosine-type recombinase/integrase n=1 Tax=Mesorhizobium sp. BR1-1-16 TaxID=2876653 RepID=UPI001CCE1100|nr:site-specific integrase [Mesorhizobium sp. BR1-1-16]MBZ9939196.1 tyrosine-type recombinase/integrase [Mesorhizobium sp. BR1-1-16]